MLAPFVRPLHVGPALEQGKDVTAVQRALRSAGALTKPVLAAAYAENTWEAVRRFQQLNGIQATGNYGKPTHQKLAGYFDQYGCWLLTEALSDLKNEPRARVVDTAFWYYGVRTGIRYSQARPIPTVYYGIRPPDAPSSLDCSGFAITCYWVAGLGQSLGDENAHGWGNTWSLSKHGKLVDVPRLGDLVFYGRTISHVAVYVGNGRVLSLGSYPMGHYPIDYRGDRHSIRSYLP